MIWCCLDSLMILLAFAIVYIVPPLLVLRRLQSFTDRATLLTLSAGLGLSSQALLGFCWNHLVGSMPIIEGTLYFLIWLTIGLALQWRKKNIQPNNQQPTTAPFPLFLPLILLAAISLRSLDALNHASLGQSDAYTHLQFLRDVLQYGQIRNIVYPPGYSWTLALPVMTFNLDAYLVARYVGPFFGGLLVASLYLLGRRHNQATGLYTAFLAAVCPIFYPLIKTGMGAFANQMGLFLLPLALLFYLMEARFLFTIILLGLTVTVPLFVFSLALIVALGQLLSCRVVKLSKSADSAPPSAAQQPNNSNTMLPKPQRWWRKNLLLLIPFLLAFAVAGYHFLTPGQEHVKTTATLVTGIPTPSKKLLAPTAPRPPFLTKIKFNPAGKLTLDLLTVKRLGLGSLMMNAAGLILAGLFTVILVNGFQNKSDILKLTGGLGLLTTLQVTTGFLEFSLYQRSGWVLMEVMALAGGILLAWFQRIHPLRKLIHFSIGLGLSASLLLAFWIPPAHRCITSGAENELATVLRELSVARIETLHIPGPHSFEKPAPHPLIARAAKAPNLALFTRQYTLFNGNQGNMSEALPDPTTHILQIPVELNSQLTPPFNHFLCLVDRSSGLPDMGLLDLISPDLTHSLTGYQSKLYQPNKVILAFLASLPTEVWQITREERGQNLSVYLIEHRQP